jgi:hypothetical protein
MKPLKTASIVSLGLVASVLAGCGDSGGSGTGLTPFRDSWEVEAEVPFEYRDGDGNPQITSISIGNSTPIGDNFMNRGDVIVKFADTSNITVELRRFTMASNEDLAQEDFDALQLWAYSASAAPPSDVDPETDCTSGAWQNDCRIMVYYDGQTQLQRSGADIRVTLPNEYRETLDIATSDNDTDSDYHNRGDVCVEGLNGTLDVDIGNGRAFVILDPATTPMPRCPAADIMTCEGWPDGSGSEAWASECPCVAGIGEFGQVQVQSQDAASANVTVDIPGTLWASMTMNNEATGQDRSADCGASEPDGTCCASVDIPGYMVDPSIGDEQSRDPWSNKGTVNHPSSSAIMGAGYSIILTSKECAPVTSTSRPEDFVGKGNGSEQSIDERGNLTVCDGCIRSTGCDGLL